MENTNVSPVMQPPVVIGFIHIPEKVVEKCTCCKDTLGKYNKAYFTSNLCRACEEDQMFSTY